jgi:excisionase family DNA binding protein
MMVGVINPGPANLERLLSPRQLADAIGVSESSLKRWIDDGLLEASRTVGRHRRIPLAEAIRFIRTRRAPLVRPEVLGLSDLGAAGDESTGPRDEAERLFALLVDGRSAAVRGFILRMYLGGRSVAEIADSPLRQAMSRLGELWTHAAEGIFLEHRATDICLQAVTQVRTLIEPPPDAPAAAGGAPSDDPYLLPSMLAACVLAESGFRAVNLGPSTPAETLLRAAEHLRAVVCWLSISSARDGLEMTALIENLAARLAQRGAVLVVGGHATGTLPMSPTANVRVGRSMTELAKIARTLSKSP